MDGQTEPRRSRTIAEGVEVRTGKRKESYRITFIHGSQRRRETLNIPVTPSNDRYAVRFRGEIINAIERGTFDYAKTFPNSRVARVAVASRERRAPEGLLR